MSTDLVVLAVLMFAATYPARAVGLLAPAVDRLPAPALDYLRLVGPAILASVASVTVLVALDPTGTPTLDVGVEWVAVLVSVVVTARSRNLLAGLVVAVVIVVIARAAEIGGLPG